MKLLMRNDTIIQELCEHYRTADQQGVLYPSSLVLCTVKSTQPKKHFLITLKIKQRFSVYKLVK